MERGPPFEVSSSGGTHVVASEIKLITMLLGYILILAATMERGPPFEV